MGCPYDRRCGVSSRRRLHGVLIDCPETVSFIPASLVVDTGFPSDSVRERTACLTRFTRPSSDSDRVRAAIRDTGGFLHTAQFDRTRHQRLLSTEPQWVTADPSEFAITAGVDCDNESFGEIVRRPGIG